MASNNEVAQLMKIMERMQAMMDGKEKKKELMATTLQIFTKGTPRKDNEMSYNKEGEDHGKGDGGGKKNEEGGKKGASQTNPRLGYIEQLLKESFIMGFTSILKGKLSP